MEGMKHEQADMEEAHMSHKIQYGGEFFMAPNKTHHLEAIYSKECGFTLVMYNAHVKPINVNRFHAIIKYVPEDKDEYEFIRFLLPTKDGSLLKAENTPAIRGPFEIELYVKFPDKDEPELFNIPVAIAGSSGSDAKQKISRPGGGTEKTGAAHELNIRNQKIEGSSVVRVHQGDSVHLRWTTDETVDLHLHGYDIEITVQPGREEMMTFKARATGRFPITVHGFGDQKGQSYGGSHHGDEHGETVLIYLEVHPR